MKKYALSIAALALSAGTLTACGGVPTDASVEDFCQGFEDISNQEVDPTDEDFDSQDYIEDLQSEVEDIRETGTPEDISDDAREGFDFTTQAILDVDPTISEEEFAEFDESFSEEEKEKSEAFDDYLSETCDA